MCSNNWLLFGGIFARAMNVANMKCACVKSKKE